MAIVIKPSATADTRTCDFASVTKQQLLNSSVQHISDVQQALSFFKAKLDEAARNHDPDKLTDIDGFHADFVHGFGVGHCDWWTRHRRLNRHHLTMADGVPSDVNLIDVLDFVADCVMAGMARSGSVYELKLDPDVLNAAFQNTVTLMKAQVVVGGAFPCIDVEGTHSGCPDKSECRRAAREPVTPESALMLEHERRAEGAIDADSKGK